jgi:alpha-glucosidase
MVNQLHDMGFKVALWVVPFVKESAKNFEILKSLGYLILDEYGKNPGLTRWWSGDGYLVDFSNPAAFNYYVNELKALQKKYGIDGYKLDGGDARYLKQEMVTFRPTSQNRYTDLFAEVGTYFEINEFRVSWLMQRHGLVQRLRDKNLNWSETSGLGALVPHGLAESMIGYAYFSPDMIGGGEGKDFRGERWKGMDQELFVRWAQAAALMPMMQYSYGPWHLDKTYLDICVQYTKLHNQLGDYIYQRALETRTTGRPIIQPLFFEFPEDKQSYIIKDQFMLGNRFLVAPVVTQGALTRNVYLPPGLWKDFWSGKVLEGAKILKDYDAPIEKLPIFVRIN